MSLFLPDGFYRTVYDIPMTLFTEQRVRLLFLDIDNTLVSYDDDEPTEDNLRWLSELRSQGVESVFLSNNHEPRVARYAAKTGCAYYSEVKKPSCDVHKRIMKERALSPANCMAVGDQIFTDVLAAHLAGCKAILVEPVKDLNTVFVKTKRLLERPFLAAYKRRQKKKGKR